MKVSLSRRHHRESEGERKNINGPRHCVYPMFCSVLVFPYLEYANLFYPVLALSYPILCIQRGTMNEKCDMQGILPLINLSVYLLGK